MLTIGSSRSHDAANAGWEKGGRFEGAATCAVKALLFAVRLQVLLGSIPRVLECFNVVGMRQLGVVGGFLNLSLHVLLSGFQVLLGGLFEMFSCLLVVFGRLLRHVLNLFHGISILSDMELSAARPTLELQDC